MPTFEKFNLPDAGEGLTEADIVEWKVAVGDTVEVNQIIVEIETAKSLVELPSPYAGVVTQILVPVGETVEVGTPIVVVDTDPDGEPPAGSGDDAVGAGVAGGSADSAGDAGSGSVLVGYGTTTEQSGRRRRQQAQPAAETDTTPAVPHVADAAPTGTSVANAKSPGTNTVDTWPTGTSTDVSPTGGEGDGPGRGGSGGGGEERGADGRPGPSPSEPAVRTAQEAAPSAARWADPARTAESTRPTAPAVQGAPATLAPRPTSYPAAAHSYAVLAKPPVRKLARDLGISLESVAGTGPGGIITREDVQAFAAQTEPRTYATYSGDDAPWLDSGTVSSDGRQTRVPVKSVRKRTAEAMVASAFTAPHVSVFHTVDVTKTMRLVEALRKDREFADVRVTPLLIAAKALLLAVRRHPEVNASWDSETQEIVYKHYVNLGIAAATPRGLVVPNIKDAHRLDLLHLAQGLADLTAAARVGKTTPTAMSDGTITITNVGVFGIDTGTPILNPGEAAILAFGAIREMPWVHKGKIKKRWVTQLALSFDHRLVDGELGARVLADVARVMEEPARGLVWA